MDHTQLYKDNYAKGERKGQKAGEKKGQEEGEKSIVLLQLRTALGEDAALEAALMAASDATRLEVALALVTTGAGTEAKRDQVRALLLPGKADRSTRGNGAPRGTRRRRSSPRSGGRG